MPSMNEPLMTAKQFISYAEEMLFGEGTECLHERIAEVQGEINMFGDSGPGSMLRLRESVTLYNNVAARYEQLTGAKVQRLRMPYHPVSWDSFQDEGYEGF